MFAASARAALGSSSQAINLSCGRSQARMTAGEPG